MPVYLGSNEMLWLTHFGFGRNRLTGVLKLCMNFLKNELKFAIDIDLEPNGISELTYGKSEVDVGYTTLLVDKSINSTRSPSFN